MLFSYIPCTDKVQSINMVRIMIIPNCRKKFLNLFKKAYVQKLYFIYINSINNIYRIYAYELNHNSYFAIRIRRFWLHANEGF